MGTNTLLIPEFKITGAALATCISVIIYNLLRYWYLKWKLSIQPFSKQTIMVLLILVVYLLIGTYLPVDFKLINNPIIRSLVNIFVRTIIVGVPILITAYFLKLSDVINRVINEILGKIKSNKQ